MSETTEKTLSVQSVRHLKESVSDVEVRGDPDQWVLVCKAWSERERWMKSTKAMQLPGGVLFQVTKQQGDNVAEALQFVPGIGMKLSALGEIEFAARS